MVARILILCSTRGRLLASSSHRWPLAQPLLVLILLVLSCVGFGGAASLTGAKFSLDDLVGVTLHVVPREGDMRRHVATLDDISTVSHLLVENVTNYKR